MKLLVTFYLIFFMFFLVGCNNKNEPENSNIEYNRLSTNELENTLNISPVVPTPVVPTPASPIQENAEVDISSFTTKILDKKSQRQNNVQLTCEKLNGAVVGPSEVFSFCNTVGQATPALGYQKADIFDAKGNKVKGYGGGKCQVSSTLYNAVLAISEFEIIERHKHSRHVDYVPDGKDATVAFGSVDFKFKNTFPYNIKIYAQASEDEITIRIAKINNSL